MALQLTYLIHRDIYGEKSEIEKQYENILTSIYKQLTERQLSNVIILYIFSHFRSSIIDYECFLKCYKKRKATLVNVFTSKIELVCSLYDCNMDNEDEFTIEQWLIHFDPVLSNLIKKNGIKSIGVDNATSIETRNMYRQQLLSLCGINML